MRKVKFGVIGCNPLLRAGFVYSGFSREKAILTAVCDCDPEMFAAFQNAYPDLANVPFYGDYRDLIADTEVEAVFVMVQDRFHEDIAVAALEQGKAVYLEKPMAITIEGCDRILETAFRTGSKLMVGHNMRYMDFIRKMKEIIDSGVIGEIQSVWCRHFINYGSCYFRHWCAEQRNSNGLLLQKGAHDIDIIHWLAGGYTTTAVAMGKLSVYNRTSNHLQPGEKPDRQASFKDDCWPPLEIRGLNSNMDVEDHSMILMQLDNGVQASYEQCMYAPDNERNYTFIGTRGRVENAGDFNSNAEIHLFTSRRSRNDPDVIYKINTQPGSHGGSDGNILEAFWDFLLQGISPAVSPIAARNAVAAGAAGHHSMRNGNIPVDIPPLPREWITYFENGQKK